MAALPTSFFMPYDVAPSGTPTERVKGRGFITGDVGRETGRREDGFKWRHGLASVRETWRRGGGLGRGLCFRDAPVF